MIPWLPVTSDIFVKGLQHYGSFSIYAFFHTTNSPFQSRETLPSIVMLCSLVCLWGNNKEAKLEARSLPWINDSGRRPPSSQLAVLDGQVATMSARSSGTESASISTTSATPCSGESWNQPAVTSADNIYFVQGPSSATVSAASSRRVD
jgi:hypothetical protein